MHSRLYKRIEGSTIFYVSSLCSCSKTTMAVINCQLVFCFVMLLLTPGLGSTELSHGLCQAHIGIGTLCHQPHCTEEVCKPKFGPQAHGVCSTGISNEYTCTCSYPCRT